MPNGPDASKSSKSLFSILVVAVPTIGFVLAVWLHWPGFDLTINPGQIANVLAPLFLAAAFIERAVEVVVSPIRDQGRGELQDELEAEQKKVPADPDAIKAAQKALDRYYAQTQKLSYAASLGFGFAAAIAGIRALWPFIPALANAGANATKSADWLASTAHISLQQANFFLGFDIVLTAALLSGGASGIHSAVSAVTSFLDASANQSQKKGDA